MDEQTMQAPDLEKIRDEMKEKGEELIGRAVEFAREQPHLAVAAAFGIGWILGNGLSPKIVTAGARLGMKTLLGGALAGTGLAGIMGGEGNPLSFLTGQESEEEPQPRRAPKKARRREDVSEGESSGTGRRNGNVE